MRILLAVLIATFLLGGSCVGVITDYWWYDSLGYAAVFTRLLGTQVLLGGCGFGLLLGILLINAWIARRVRPVGGIWVGKNVFELGQAAAPAVERVSGRLLGAVCLVIAALSGLETAAQAHDALLFWHGGGGGFSKADPVFGLDAGFYVFRLPFLQYLFGWSMFAILLTLALSTLLHVYYRGIQVGVNRVHLTPGARRHLLLLLAVLLFLYAAHFQLSAYGLVCHEGSLLYGATYTDLHARLPVLRFMEVLAGLCGLALLASMAVPLWRVAAGLVVLLLLTLMVGENLYPAAVQHFLVAPNELDKERPNIAANIDFTRYSYRLEKVKEEEFAVRDGLGLQDLKRNRSTLDNIRLWDREQVLAAFRQLQEIRAYYDFIDADNDRYTIDGRLTQVSLSPREMSYHMSTRNWINEHLTYTHGFGVCAGPVAQKAEEGLPALFVRNIPPESTKKELEVSEPRIYFGEKSNEYVFVDTAAKEFDYPSTDDVYTHYSGQGGVPAGSSLRKLLFSLRFGEPKILLSSDIHSASRVLFYRSVRERASQVTPWVIYDKDPYMVISGGRLYWILDGYTTASTMPYAQPVVFRERFDLNYIRNSVKTVVDAYQGTVTAYLYDEHDPVAQCYARIFPGVYHAAADMPPDLRRHVRYPEELFSIQAAMLSLYHMEDPQVFYNKEDVWRLPLMDSAEMAPYYTVLKFPGGSTEEFILMTAFTPANKANMIAWMAGRCDGADYGQLKVYTFPKKKLIYGPSQIDARINQSPDISGQLTLWNQKGSKVTWGSLLVIPIEETLMYVRPLYLEASSTSVPELKEVVVSYGNRVAMKETLEGALAAVFHGSVEAAADAPETPPPSSGSPTPAATATSWAQLAHQARVHMDAAEKYQREGNWAKYGEELAKLKETLQRLDALGK